MSSLRHMFVTFRRAAARRALVAVVAVAGVISSPFAVAAAGPLGAASSEFALAPELPSSASLRDVTNSYRASAGVAGLTLISALNRAAQIRAQEMVANGYFAHQRPDGSSPGTVLTQVGYGWNAWGENLYMSSNDPAPSSVVGAWMNSSGHRANMLSSTFTQVGFGSASTANFAGQGPRTIVVAIYARPNGASLQAPSAPQSFTATSPGVGQARLTWAAPATNGGAAITGYNYQRSADGGRTWATSGSVISASTRSVVLSGLKPGATYHFRLRARNSVGWGTVTAAVRVTVRATAPSAPPTLRATALSTGQVRLDWTTPVSNGGSTITGYAYQRSADGGRTWATGGSLFSPTTRSLVLNGLTPGVTYYFRVMARNAVGWGTPSPAAAVTPLATASATSASTLTETTADPTTTTAAPTTTAVPTTSTVSTSTGSVPTTTVPTTSEPGTSQPESSSSTVPVSTEPASTSTEATVASMLTSSGS